MILEELPNSRRIGPNFSEGTSFAEAMVNLVS